MVFFNNTQIHTDSLSVANLPMRTTSFLEGFNSVLNRTIAANPNFYYFVERLQNHESRKADEMSNLVHDPLPKNQFRPKHKKDQERDMKIKHNTELLCAGKLSVAGFLEAMASVDDCTYIYQ